MVGQGRGPSNDVNPVHGAGDGATGRDFMKTITEVVEQSHPSGSQELLGIGFGVGPEERPCLQGLGGEPDDGVVLGPQV